MSVYPVKVWIKHPQHPTYKRAVWASNVRDAVLKVVTHAVVKYGEADSHLWTVHHIDV